MALQVNDQAEVSWLLELRRRPWAHVAEDLAWRYRKWVALFITAVYLMSFNGLWRVGRDSALYLSVARNIARGDGYVYQGEAHRLSYPGLTYLLAGIMKVAGDHAILIADAVMLGCGLLSLYLCYRLFRLVVRPGAAVLITLFTAVNCELYELAFEIQTDMPFLLGSVMVILGGAFSGMLPAPRLDPEAQVPSSRQHVIGWGSLVLGMAICAVMRPTFYAIAACVFAASCVTLVQRRQWRSVLAVLGMALLVIGILSAAWLADPRRDVESSDVYEQALIVHLKTAVSNPGIIWDKFTRLVSPELPVALFGYSWSAVLDPLVFVVVIGLAVWVLRRWPMAMLWIAATLALQLVVERPSPRYLVVLVPFFTLAWWESASRLNARMGGARGNLIALVAYLVLVPGFFRCLGMVWYEQYRRPYVQYVRGGDYAAIYELAEAVRQNTPSDAVLIVPDRMDRVLAYLSDRWVVAHDQVIPPHFHERPVYVVHGTNDEQTRKRLRMVAGFGGEGALATTRREYRDDGQLLLREAKWFGQ